MADVEVIRYGDVSKMVTEGAKGCLLKTAIGITAIAKTLAPVDTGQLRGSITYVTDTGARGQVDNGAKQLDGKPKKGEAWAGTASDHAVFVEFGTKPHKIQPKNANELAFKGKDGSTVIRKSVNHPGTVAQPFLRPAGLSVGKDPATQLAVAKEFQEAAKKEFAQR